MKTEYSIQTVAEELGLEPEDLKDIYDSYFEETREMLGQWRELWEKSDTEQLAKLFHGMKGASNNLRMDELGELAKEAEGLCKAKTPEAIPSLMEPFEREFAELEAFVQEFYGA